MTSYETAYGSFYNKLKVNAATIGTWVAVIIIVGGGVSAGGWAVWNEAVNDYAGLDRDEAIRDSASDFLEEYGWLTIDPAHTFRNMDEMPDYETIEKSHMGRNEVWAAQYKLRSGHACILLWDKPSDGGKPHRMQYQAINGECP